MTRWSPIVTDTALSGWTAAGPVYLLPPGGRTQPNLEPNPRIDRECSKLSSWVGEEGGDRFETDVWYKSTHFPHTLDQTRPRYFRFHRVPWRLLIFLPDDDLMTRDYRRRSRPVSPSSADVSRLIDFLSVSKAQSNLAIAHALRTDSLRLTLSSLFPQIERNWKKVC